MSSTAIVNVDLFDAVLGYSAPTIKSPSISVHTNVVAPSQALRVAAKLGLSPAFLTSLPSKHAGKPNVWRTVDSLRTVVAVTNRLPSPQGVTEVPLCPVSHCTARIPYAGAVSEGYAHLVRIMFSTYQAPTRTASLRVLPDGTHRATLRGFPSHDGVALQFGQAVPSQSHALVLAFDARGRLLSDACAVYWTVGASSPATWAALPTLSTLMECVRNSQPSAVVAVHPDTDRTPTPSEAGINEDVVMRWFATLPVHEAFAFLKRAGEAYSVQYPNVSGGDA